MARTPSADKFAQLSALRHSGFGPADPPNRTNPPSAPGLSEATEEDQKPEPKKKDHKQEWKTELKTELRS
ncbi:MAG: hypothetical protein NVS9B4_10000 [Candidatus Acidiferrum sp.]